MPLRKDPNFLAAKILPLAPPLPPNSVLCSVYHILLPNSLSFSLSLALCLSRSHAHSQSHFHSHSYPTPLSQLKLVGADQDLLPAC